VRLPNRISVKNGEVDAVQRELGGVLRDVVVDAESRVVLASEEIGRASATQITTSATLLHTYQVPKSDLPTVNRECIAMLNLQVYVTATSTGFRVFYWLDVDGVETSRVGHHLGPGATIPQDVVTGVGLWKVTVKPDTRYIRAYALVTGTGTAYIGALETVQLAVVG
jgi:hypothetical protein